MLPGLDGIKICWRLRGDANYTPILMLTYRSAEADQVAGLDIGGDNYLTKPFSIPEFLSRVKAIFRRPDRLVRQTGTAESSRRTKY